VELLEIHPNERKASAPAIAVAARWARQFWISRRGFETALVAARAAPVELIRVRWRGVTRRAVVRHALTDSRLRNLAEPLDPAVVDPWTETAGSLAAAPRRAFAHPGRGRRTLHGPPRAAAA
jgi:hypothetical protein